ncbi:MAG: hypothetical protein VX908_00870 [Planctomycetota bacterium]|nr:hypothetical protein [Planctomycetota bacterium]
MSNAADKPDAFPKTMGTWIDRQLQEGTLGRDVVNRHIMSVYAHPLKVYFLGSSMRTLGEPDDMVDGFFASRLQKESYFDQWKESGLRLRRWLMNGFLFHLKEEIRRQKRHGDSSLDQELDSPVDASPDLDFDRAWAMSMVQGAWKDAASSCEEEGFGNHWQLFIRHHVDGLPYKLCVEEFDVSPSQAAVMVRTATGRFKDALRMRILLDGLHEDDVDGELLRLMEIMQ